MKKTLYIISVLLLAAVGCTKEQSLTENSEKAAFPEGAMVTVNFSIPSQADTRANGMANEPEIENLYVAVFNSAGLLQEYTAATPIGDYADENGVWCGYKVQLLLSSTERRLHFIANGPGKGDIGNGSETAVIRNLITENGAAAYWQRVVLKEGVTPYAYPGGQVTFTWYDDQGHPQSKTYGVEGATSYVDAENKTVNVGDYVQENGNKVVDGTGYFASVKTSTALEKIPLIRNFARVTLVDDNSTGVTFHPDKFILVNTPTQGYIAPYDAKAGEYVVPYTDMYANVAHWGEANYLFKFDDVYDWGYSGEMPQTASIVPLASNPEATEAQIKAYVNDSNNWLDVGTYGTESSYKFGYMYERSLPSAVNTPTCVLVHGVLSDTEAHARFGARWFKIEITDLDGNYVPIYRDVTYIMMIKNIAIVGTPGWETAYEAYKNKSVGDVSTSTETATLTQISDGKGTTLWVEYIDYTSVERQANTATILYKLFYQENSSSAEEILTGETLTDESLPEPLPYVTLTVEHYDGIGHAITTDTVTGSAYTGQTPDGKGGWYQAEVPLAGQGNVMYKSRLHIEGLTKAGHGAKSIFRNVDYRVIPTQYLTLSVSPAKIPTGVNQEVALTIDLPKDLGYSVFPLVLKIEPKDGNLNPNASKNVINDEAIGLPVEYGPTMFTDQGKTGNTFYFLFTVNFSDYNQSTGSSYTLYFNTIRNGDNATTIAVQDKKPYFEMARISFQCEE